MDGSESRTQHCSPAVVSRLDSRFAPNRSPSERAGRGHLRRDAPSVIDCFYLQGLIVSVVRADCERCYWRSGMQRGSLGYIFLGERNFFSGSIS